jgi:peptidoglycan/LPS O-acetylase OafA/YrhL
MSGKSHHLGSLEALRGVAALIVLIHHACGTIELPKNFGRELFGGVFATGQFGVDIFFVLSGFIIFYTNSRDKVGPAGVRKYCLRRFFRIYPVYWFICLFWIPLVFLMPGIGHATLERSAPEALHSILLLPYGDFPILGPAWSLCFEVMFYVAFIPFLINRKLGWVVWSTWLAVVIFLKATNWVPPNAYAKQAFSELVLLFFAGMVVALVCRKFPQKRASPWVLGGALLILIQAYLEWRMGQSALPHRHLVYGLGSAATVYGLACGDIRSAWKIPVFWQVLGMHSYSIYLVHRPVQQGLTKYAANFLGPQPEWSCYATFVVIAGISLGAGILVGRYFEQPALAYCKARWIR